MGVSINLWIIYGEYMVKIWLIVVYGCPWGYPKSWIVYKGKSQSKMDDLGVPNFRTPPYGNLFIWDKTTDV